MAIRQPRRPRSEKGAHSPYDGALMSEAAYRALPDEKPALEYWDGVVVQEAVGNRAHSKIQYFLGFLLWSWIAWPEGQPAATPDAFSAGEDPSCFSLG